MTAGEQKDGHDRAKRQRSLAIAWALAILVLIFYAATIVRLGPNALNRDTFGTPLGTPPAPEAPGDDCKRAGTC